MVCFIFHIEQLIYGHFTGQPAGLAPSVNLRNREFCWSEVSLPTCLSLGIVIPGWFTLLYTTISDLTYSESEKTYTPAVQLSALHAAVNNIVQKNKYYYELRLFMTTFSQLRNSWRFSTRNPGIKGHYP